MFPARYAPIVFGFILSGLMSFMVSGVATLRATGLIDDFMSVWMSAWIPSWMLAFPAVLVVAPVTRRVVAKLVRAD